MCFFFLYLFERREKLKMCVDRFKKKDKCLYLCIFLLDRLRICLYKIDVIIKFGKF